MADTSTSIDAYRERARAVLRQTLAARGTVHASCQAAGMMLAARDVLVEALGPRDAYESIAGLADKIVTECGEQLPRR